MITSENIKEVMKLVGPHEYREAIDAPGEYLLLEVHATNTGATATIESLEYSEATEKEANDSGQFYAEKEHFEEVITQLGAKPVTIWGAVFGILDKEYNAIIIDDRTEEEQEADPYGAAIEYLEKNCICSPPDEWLDFSSYTGTNDEEEGIFNYNDGEPDFDNNLATS